MWHMMLWVAYILPFGPHNSHQKLGTPRVKNSSKCKMSLMVIKVLFQKYLIDPQKLLLVKKIITRFRILLYSNAY